MLVVRRPSLPVWTTNAVSFPLAPTITVERPAGTPAPLAVVAGDTVTLTCRAPRDPPEQEGHVELMPGHAAGTDHDDCHTGGRYDPTDDAPFHRSRGAGRGVVPSACASMGSTVCRSW